MFLALFFFHARSDLLFQVLVKWENTVLHLWPSIRVCAALSPPLSPSEEDLQRFSCMAMASVIDAEVWNKHPMAIVAFCVLFAKDQIV